VPGFESYEWPGLVARAGTPRDIITRLHQAVVKVVANPEIRSRLEVLGSYPVGSSPTEFRDFIRKEMALWEKVARDIRADELKGR
jgi:tripartite-type tricarboxylate transporter receptor subunit TctC